MPPPSKYGRTQHRHYPVHAIGRKKCQVIKLYSHPSPLMRRERSASTEVIHQFHHYQDHHSFPYIDRPGLHQPAARFVRADDSKERPGTGWRWQSRIPTCGKGRMTSAQYHYKPNRFLLPITRSLSDYSHVKEMRPPAFSINARRSGLSCGIRSQRHPPRWRPPAIDL